MQHRQALLRFNNRTRFKRHPTTTREEALERLPYTLAAYHLLAVNHQNRVGLIQGDQSFNIAEVEGIPEESMDFGWVVCGHPVRPCRVCDSGAS